MNKINSTYLSLYKEYEALVRETGKEPKEYEDSLPEPVWNKLRMCRQLRNFLAHDSDEAFLTAGKGQVAFMEKVIAELKVGKDTLQQHSKSVAVGTCSPKDRITDALDKMVKFKVDKLIVYDEKTGVCSLLSIYTAIPAALASKTTKVSDIKLAKGNFFYSKADAEYDRVSHMAKNNGIDAVLITKDGEIGSPLTGIVYID